MDMDVNRKAYSSFAIDCSHLNKWNQSSFAKRQQELNTIRQLRESNAGTKTSTTSEEENIALDNNKKMLKALLEMARGTSASVYTEDSIKDLAYTMSKAASVSVSKNAKPSDVTKALNQLRSSLSALKVAERKDKKGDAGEMLESDLITVNGSVRASQESANAAVYGNITGAVNVTTSVSISVSAPAVNVPTVDVSI